MDLMEQVQAQLLTWEMVHHREAEYVIKTAFGQLCRPVWVCQVGGVELGDRDFQRAGDLHQVGRGVYPGVRPGMPIAVQVGCQQAVAAADIQQPGFMRERLRNLDHPGLKLLPGGGEMLGKGLVKLMVKLEEL